jgi:phospholipase C
VIAVTLALALAAAACGGASAHTTSTRAAPPPRAEQNLHLIKHVVVIMQENRSFDDYFGTYPGADGLPRTKDGSFAVCLPQAHGGACEHPYHDPHDVNGGAAHGQASAIADIDGGRMDGFVRVAQTSVRGCPVAMNPICGHGSRIDVMGYHDAREIPNYWRYAHDFVLQDHMFSSVASWSCPSTSSSCRAGRRSARHDGRRVA